MTRSSRAVGRLAAGLLVTALAVAIGGCAAGIATSIHSEPERLALARRLSAKGDCQQAVLLLRTYVERNVGGAEVDEAIYELGSCELQIKEWASAALDFERLLRDYPESDSAASASFRLGQAYYGQARPVDFEQEETRKALDQWERYRRTYPGHWLNAEADRSIAMARHKLARKLADTGLLYYKLKLAEPARIYYQRIVDEYADTAVLGDALIGLAMTDALEGRKSEAIAQLKAIEAQFPDQPIGHRAARERSHLEH